MPVQTDHAVCCRHYKVKIVGREQNAATSFVANFSYQFVKFGLSMDVDIRCWLVQNQQIWFAQQGARQPTRLSSPPDSKRTS